MAECVKCGKAYPNARADLGYDTCLRCGQKEAKKEIVAKSRRVAPLYNKGGLMYIGETDPKGWGKVTN